MIVFISDTDQGGAAISCRRLLRGLRGVGGPDARWLSARGTTDGEHSSLAEWPPVGAFLRFRLLSRLLRREAARRQAVNAFTEATVLAALRTLPASLVHLHNIHEGMSFGLLERLPSTVPIIWTLHDMWPLTGYCYYSYACPQYTDGCQGVCPELGRCGAAVRPPGQEWSRRDRLLRRLAPRLALAAPSRWMARCAKDRFGDAVRVEHIPYGVDLQTFRPLGDRRLARQALGLPVDVPLILTGAASLDEPRKGLAELREAAGSLTARLGTVPLLLALGAGRPPAGGGVAMAFTGTVRDEALLNLYYNAADVFVLPTRADNLPNMLVESVAAGTPMVACDVGGCGDVVRPGETGLLAAPGDPHALADAVGNLLAAPAPERALWSARCRAVAERDYDAALQARRYLALYGDLLGACGSPGQQGP